jgi:hypothetical protein
MDKALHVTPWRVEANLDKLSRGFGSRVELTGKVSKEASELFQKLAFALPGLRSVCELRLQSFLEHS